MSERRLVLVWSNAQVRQVWYDPGRHEWAVVLEHESFAPIPEGAALTIIEGPTMCEATELQRRSVQLVTEGGLICRCAQGGCGRE